MNVQKEKERLDEIIEQLAVRLTTCPLDDFDAVKDELKSARAFRAQLDETRKVKTPGEVKLRWEVSPAPTGRYRSFETRSWPMAYYAGTDRMAVQVLCKDEYSPKAAKNGNHAPLTLLFADYSVGRTPEGRQKHGALKWQKLKSEFEFISDAKEAALRLIQNHPELWPDEVRI